MPHRVGGPLPTAARQGREQQRYGDGGERLVAGCIPLRYISSEGGPASMEVLMISSRGGKGFVFPKGGWEEDETVEAAAQRETVEEAGVRGALQLPLGTFPFASGKAERLGTGQRGRCVAYMFSMAVSEVLETWPEAGQRMRVWCSLREAYNRARYDWMRDALRALMERNGWDVEGTLRQEGASSPDSVDLTSAGISPTAAASVLPVASEGLGPEAGPGITVQT